MTTYNDILNQIKTLNDKEQNRLFEELKKRLNASSQDEFSEQDLAESKSEWQMLVVKIQGNTCKKLN